MNNIYLIMTGCYSDTRCVGYCTTEDEAKKYCAAKNGTQGKYFEEYYYHDCECLDGAMQGYADLGVTVEFSFTPGRKGLEQEFRSNDPIPSIRHPIKIYPVDDSRGTVVIRLWQKEYNPEKARKVVQDALYKWLAEEEQLAAERYERLQNYLTEEEQLAAERYERLQNYLTEEEQLAAERYERLQNYLTEE